jgi:hypothetical protein
MIVNEQYSNGHAFAVASLRAWGIRLGAENVLRAVKADERVNPARAAGMLDAMIAAALDARGAGRL